MRWSREGANALLQVRCAALNGLDIRHFKRWYPPDQRLMRISAKVTGDFGSVTASEPMLCCAGKIVGTMSC